MVVSRTVMRTAFMARGHLVAMRMFAMVSHGVGVVMARIGRLWSVLIHTWVTESGRRPYTFSNQRHLRATQAQTRVKPTDKAEVSIVSATREGRKNAGFMRMRT